MRSLAFVEVRRIATFINAQREAVKVMEDVAADFLSDHPECLPSAQSESDILCVVGAERGFCGDFNGRLLGAARTHAETTRHAGPIVLVGARLADAWKDAAHFAVDGASVVEDVPAVIARLLARFANLLAPQSALAGLLVLYHDARAVRLRRLLPFTPPAARAPRQAFPLQLQLAPGPFLQAMADHYLYCELHTIFLESLLEENRRRLEHMQSAREQLDNRLVDLERRQRRLRQEEITQEIELILLSATS
jgi:F-type H+-transporting ATPase subunit gamma